MEQHRDCEHIQGKRLLIDPVTKGLSYEHQSHAQIWHKSLCELNSKTKQRIKMTFVAFVIAYEGLVCKCMRYLNWFWKADIQRWQERWKCQKCSSPEMLNDEFVELRTLEKKGHCFLTQHSQNFLSHCLRSDIKISPTIIYLNHSVYQTSKLLKDYGSCWDSPPACTPWK